MKRICSLLAVAALVTGACGDFTMTDPNSPGQIGNNPTRARV